MKPAKVTLLHRMLHCLKHVDCNIVKYFTSTYLLVNISLFVIILFPFSVIAEAEDEYANFEELKTIQIHLIMAFQRRKETPAS